MTDPNSTLDAQIINRVRQFLQSTNVSQSRLAAAVGSDPGNFSAFLSNCKSLSVTKMSKLMMILGLNRTELEARFNNPPVTARIENFQSLDGRTMKLDNENWTPGQQGSDPASGATITDDDTSNSDADDYQAATRDFLKSQLGLHRSAIRAIKSYLQNQNSKATVNP
jgi:hypothetical protein